VVFLFGRVQAADGTSEQLVVRSGTETEIELIVRDVPATVTERVEAGSSVQIYGTLREGSSAVVAEAVVVDFGDGTDRLYAYGTSILGGILAALYFLRYWYVDLRRLRLTPRGDR
jgi:hypothetical protein